MNVNGKAAAMEGRECEDASEEERMGWGVSTLTAISDLGERG